eukprot:XP_003724073.1 PREDICTED: NADH dehydrogenase [ubiquinone] 1 beta subcomplex subunit 5, mitochondrial isoform X1 [Strongylocentrotus purpuratus]
MAFVGTRLLFRSLQVVRLNSPLLRGAVPAKCAPKNSQAGALIARGMAGGGGKMFIKASRYTDLRFLRAMRYYFLLTGVPVVIVITLINVFIGEAEYAEIPEDYVPKHWEHYKHPITRWLSRFVIPSPQQEYEKMAHFMDIEGQKIKARSEEREVKRLMRSRGEGHWYYYPVATPPNWKSQEEMKE